MLNLTNRHVFITGGSSGLGLAIAHECVRRGAHVIICARRESVLMQAISLLTSISTRSDQIISYVTADCTDPDSIACALDKAIILSGNLPPYLVICNAGSSLPKTFLDHSPSDFDWNIRTNYLSAVYTAHAALHRMVNASRCNHDLVHGKIVFISSMASLVTFTGYSAYSPSKAAVNSLARALRHEVLGGIANNVSIHTFLPGSIDTPAFSHEQKIKPLSTKYLERDDEIMSPTKCCEFLFLGLDNGHLEITTNFNGELLRALHKGQTPSNSIFDFFIAIIAWFALIIWRRTDLIPAGKKMPAIP